MFLIIGFIVVGIPIGYLLKTNEKVKKIVSELCSYTIYALLFFLGLQMGANEKVMASLGTIGLKALIFALTVSFGSAMAGILVKKLLKAL